MRAIQNGSVLLRSGAKKDDGVTWTKINNRLPNRWVRRCCVRRCCVRRWVGQDVATLTCIQICSRHRAKHALKRHRIQIIRVRQCKVVVAAVAPYRDRRGGGGRHWSSNG